MWVPDQSGCLFKLRPRPKLSKLPNDCFESDSVLLIGPPCNLWSRHTQLVHVVDETDAIGDTWLLLNTGQHTKGHIDWAGEVSFPGNAIEGFCDRNGVPYQLTQIIEVDSALLQMPSGIFERTQRVPFQVHLHVGKRAIDFV